MGEIVVPIFEFASSDLPDLHDGSLLDWEDRLPGASADFRDFLAVPGIGESPVIDPSDLVFRVFLGWHPPTGRLFVAIERIDDVYVNAYEEGKIETIWKCDGVEVLVDGDHSGGPYQGFPQGSEEERRRTNTGAQRYVAVPESPDDRILSVFEPEGSHTAAELAWVADRPYADAGGWTEPGVPHSSSIELYVTPFDELNLLAPEQSVASQLTVGAVIGIQLQVPDFDAAAGEYRGFYNLGGVSSAWRDAGQFADGLLIPCEWGDCAGGGAPLIQRVATDTWGRIKAGLPLRGDR